jgi:GMP synthase (glutamine-hydrolysing)
MQSLLIVKLGSTEPALAESHGDFEDWIAARLGVDPGRIAVVDPQRASLPDPRRFAGVILTGSHSMVTDHEEWSERTADWIPAVMDAGTPLLGICYGHQLIAHALGGEVGPNPRGDECGTVPITLHDAARTDPLFAGLPATILAQTSHSQSVLQLPPGAVWLASSRHDPHHAYAVGPTTWGVQFHPEFAVAAMKAYLEEHFDQLRTQGGDPLRIRPCVAETPHAEQLLRRFAEIAAGPASA